MEIYKKRSRWRILLASLGLVIVVITSFYSFFLAQKLAEKEKKSVKLLSLALNDINNKADLNKDVTLQLEVAENNTVPVIMEDENGNLSGYNYSDEKNNDIDFLTRKKERLIARGVIPIEGSGYAKFIYFQNSKLYNYIRLYPLVQICLVGIFILLGYLVFSASRREEQNRVWAGMAKETAHQLGTPISAILAWLEHLKMDHNTSSNQMEIIHELEKDVDRLNLVADRFSKIGSAPKLERSDIYQLLNDCKVYMEKRAPRKVIFDFPEVHAAPLYSEVNQHLFVWVVENLMANSLDAMEGKGKISASVHEQNDKVVVEISDTGKGIPESKFKTVFKPGYSTKSRGWGLGLSLAKRIIEEYHRGKIFIKSSKINEGTTFAIQLPKSS